jgi:hypothetical protein
MITTRWITDDDYELIAASLEKDEYHKEQVAGFFYEENTLTNAYEDEDGPIMFLRGSLNPLLGFDALCIDIQFMDNADLRRNMSALLFANEHFVAQCKANGFKEFVFSTNSQKLKRFCSKYLGFAEIAGKMHKTL